MSLREAILESGQEIAVETNQRALIDKVLARYSGQFTVFRELLQNSDDAGASTVEMHFKSAQQETHRLQQASQENGKQQLPPLADIRMHKIEVRNDGAPFNDQDWARLRKIAEGNPDEQKIGAFGVGFYSLFSLTEEPLVSSGTSAMVFLWKKDQLYVRQGDNTNAETDKSPQGKPWTTFDISLRQPEVMPHPEDFCRFLADALVFTVRLRSIRVYMDSFLLCDLHKKTAPSHALRVPSNINVRSLPLKIMSMKSIEVAPFQLDAKVIKWVTQPQTVQAAQEAAEAEAYSNRSILGGASKFLQSAFGLGLGRQQSTKDAKTVSGAEAEVDAVADLTETTTSTVFLRMIHGNIAVSCPRQLMNELERATKKKPPSQTAFSMLFSSYDEYLASVGDRDQKQAEAHRLFSKLLTDLSRQGSTAIGFMTHQTTGFSSSIGARFIPTVERESLDLMNAYTADWNKELLWMGGVLTRAVYEDQMSETRKVWTSNLDEDTQKRLLSKFIHLARVFSFTLSTPSPIVSEIMKAAFFSAAPSSDLTVLSTQGPLPVKSVRQPEPSLQAFLKTTPVLSEDVAKEAPQFAKDLQGWRLLREMEMGDVTSELRSRALTLEELQAALKWWITLTHSPTFHPSMHSAFVDAAMFSTTDDKIGERIISLSTIRFYLTASKTLLQRAPPPPEALPTPVARAFKQTDLQRVFEWTDMPMDKELQYLLSPQITGNASLSDVNMLKSPDFAEDVFNTISRNWSNTKEFTLEAVASILKQTPCLPSTAGLMRPPDVYFDNINSLQLDLPVVQFSSKTPIRGNLEKLLCSTGVRRHVDLQIIFTKLVAGGSWSHVDLVKYLLSVQDSLNAQEKKRLAQTPWLPKEGEDAAAANSKPKKYTAGELFEPTQALRVLKLPLLSWTGRFGEAESKFLRGLGLQKQPSSRTVLEVASNREDATRRQEALKYFLKNHSSLYSRAATEKDLPYVPAVRPDGTAETLPMRPTEVFSNPQCAILGFHVLPSAYVSDAEKLGVQKDPPTFQLINALLDVPPTEAGKATAVFAYLSGEVTRFDSSQLSRLKDSSIIPVPTPDGKTKLSMPKTCYFTESDSPAMAAVFTSIDFGVASRPFLMACGVRDSPTTPEIAEMLVQNANGVLKLSGSSEAYLDILRPIAAARSTLPGNLIKRLQSAQFFLTTRKVPTTEKEGHNAALEDGEESYKVMTELKAPAETVIIDDVNTGRLFGAYIYASPEEDSLELFAESLGAKRVSQVVKDRHIISRPINTDTAACAELRSLLLERTSLFLHERQASSDSDVLRGIDWLHKYLRVQEVAKIEVQRSLAFAGHRHNVALPASAASDLVSKTELLLSFTSAGIDDWFEVATSLCRFVLKKQKPNDSLVLTSLLSSPLQLLQRRGYDTSRILRSRKEERQRQLQAQRDAGLQAELSKPPPPSDEEINSWTEKLLLDFPQANRDLVKRLLQAQTANHFDAVRAQLEKGYRKSPGHAPSTSAQQPPAARPSSSVETSTDPDTPPRERSPFFSNFRRKFLGAGSQAKLPGQDETRLGQTERSMSPQPPSYSPATSKSKTEDSSGQQGQQDPTSYNDIERSVQQALQQSRADESNSVQDSGSVQHVKESESSYCDSKAASDLLFVTTVAGHRFYIDRSVQPEKFLLSHSDSIQRLVNHVIRPLAVIFAVKPDTFNIFYDTAGPLIAFNRGGTIWINLRFYLSWHDEQVKGGYPEKALLSNFFSIAHELAHNLTSAHNAQHGFYTCSIAELHFMKLASFLHELGKGRQTLVDVE